AATALSVRGVQLEQVEVSARKRATGRRGAPPYARSRAAVAARPVATPSVGWPQAAVIVPAVISRRSWRGSRPPATAGVWGRRLCIADGGVPPWLATRAGRGPRHSLD